jgi:hypothetical protein
MSERLPRYERVPGHFKAAPLSEADWQILKTIGLCRVVQSQHLDQLLPNMNTDHVRRRLQQLFHIGCLDRPDAHKALTGRHEGSASMVHTLTSKGARLLAQEHGLEVKPRKRQGSYAELKHDLATTDFLVSVVTGCARSNNLRFVPLAELLPEMSERSRRALGRGEWRVTIALRGNRRTVHPRPDGIFAIANERLQPPDNRRFFFLETDRETMSITPQMGERSAQNVGYSSLDKPSILRKFLHYNETFRQGMHVKLLGLGVTRVIFFCKTRARVENMIAAYREHANAYPKRCRFIDRETLLSADEPFYKLPWKDGDGETVGFFEEK